MPSSLSVSMGVLNLSLGAWEVGLLTHAKRHKAHSTPFAGEARFTSVQNQPIDQTVAGSPAANLSRARHASVCRRVRLAPDCPHWSRR